MSENHTSGSINNYKLNKRLYGANVARNALDRAFIEFLPKPRTVDEFFELYNEFFYILPTDTHQEFFDRSRIYAWPDWENPRLAQIRDLEAEIEQIQEQIDSLERSHPIIPNNSVLYPVDIYAGANSAETAITNQHVFYIQSNKARRILNTDMYFYIKNQQTFRQSPKPTDAEFLYPVTADFIGTFSSGPPINTEEDLRKTTLEINRYDGGPVTSLIGFDTGNVIEDIGVSPLTEY
jgi:hypothetical protein